MSANQRRGCRVTLERGTLEVHLPSGAPLDGDIVDIGVGGAGLVVAGSQHQLLERATLVLRAGDDAPFQAEVTKASPGLPLGDDRMRVGVRFQSLDDSALGALASLVIQSYCQQKGRLSAAPDERQLLIRDPERIVHALKVGAVDNHVDLTVADGTGNLPVVLRVLGLGQVGKLRGLHARLEGSPLAVLSPGAPYQFSFAGASALHRFSSTIVPLRKAGQLLLPLPELLIKSGFRESPRVGFNEVLPVSLIHPHRAGQFLTKTVVNASTRGLSFLVDPRQDAIFPEDRLVLELEDGEVWVEAVVRNFAPTNDPRKLLCGVELVRWPSREDAERWKQFVFSQMHPAVELGHGATADQAWELLETSLYVEEATGAIQDALRNAFKEVWRTARVQGRFDRFLIIRADDRPVGTVCASLVYPGTWMMHHGGVERAARKTDRRLKFEACYDLYGGMAKLIQEMDGFQHFIAYVDANKPFNHLVFTRFLNEYPTSQDNVFDTVDIFKTWPKAATAEQLSGDDPDGLRVDNGDAQLLTRLSNQLRERLPQVQFDALCLEPDRILLQELASGSKARRTMRFREVFFAWLHDEPVAAMVAEVGGPGVNIFNLLNTCWYAPLHPRAKDNWPVKRSLLRRAIQLYREQDIVECLYLEHHPSGNAERLASLGFAPPIAGLRWIARKHVLPAWIDHLNDLFFGMIEDITFKDMI